MTISIQSFPGHAGRPGQVGGSQAKGGTGGNIIDDIHAENMANSLSKKLNEGEISAIKNYAASSQWINTHLRDGEKLMKAERVAFENIKSVFAKADALQSDIIVYRAADAKHVLGSGNSFIDKGFVSTSRDKAAASKIVDNLANNEMFSKKMILVEIRIPKGTVAVPVAGKLGLSGYAHEKELLLNKDTKFKITHNDGTHAVFEVIK